MTATMPKRIKILDGATATTSPPSSATDGEEIPSWWGSDAGNIYVKSTAGSGDMDVSITAWGFDPVLEEWFSLGDLNEGSAIGETGSDSIRYVEPIVGLLPFTRLDLEITAINGTSTAIDAWIGRALVE